MSGVIEYDGKDIKSVKADVSVDMTKIDTQNERRDNHLRTGDFFEALFSLAAINLMFSIALLALLLHPQSRDYQRIWFS